PAPLRISLLQPHNRVTRSNKRANFRAEELHCNGSIQRPVDGRGTRSQSGSNPNTARLKAHQRLPIPERRRCGAPRSAQQLDNYRSRICGLALPVLTRLSAASILAPKTASARAILSLVLLI